MSCRLGSFERRLCCFASIFALAVLLLFRIDLSPNDTRDFLVFDASVLAARRPDPAIPFPGMMNSALQVEIIAP